MKPDEVLDLQLWQFNAAIAGYQDRLKDNTVIAIQTGYWSAYFSNNREQKPLNVVIEEYIGSYDHTEKVSNSEPNIKQFDARMQLLNGGERSAQRIP